MSMYEARTAMIEKIIYKYLGAVTEAGQAYRNDGIYYSHIDFMRRLLEIFDLAMDQAHVPASLRLEILERVMMSAPDPQEANSRIEALKKMTMNWTRVQ